MPLASHVFTYTLYPQVGCVSRLYVRELREVSGVEVQPLRQPLHQLRALVVGEGPGGEKQAGVTFLWSSSK